MFLHHACITQHIRVAISGITETGAVATVNIANAGSARKTVYLRHREFGDSEWDTARTKTTTGASADYNLAGLTPRTTYEVQASLSSDFAASRTAVFTTSTPDASLSRVSVDDITQTTARATAHIANPGTGTKTVHLRYRVSGAEVERHTDRLNDGFERGVRSQWTDTTDDIRSRGVAEQQLHWLEEDHVHHPRARSQPVVRRHRQHHADIRSCDRDDRRSRRRAEDVHLSTGQGHGGVERSRSDREHIRSTASIDITGLTPDTDYEVEASLDSAFGEVVSATFTTLRYPSLSAVDVTDITKTTATAEIDIADPDGTSQTVHLRYRTTPQGDWSSTLTTTSTTADASIALTGLTEETEYEVQASLTSDFAVSVSDTFTTLPPDPVVSDVSVGSIRQTTATATIDIANSNGTDQTVRLRYRTTTPRGDWSSALTTTSSTDSATIDLSHSRRAPSTRCRRRWRARSPRRAPGTTHSPRCATPASHPSRLRTSAGTEQPSVATIADSQGESQTVYIRHRQSRYIAWRSTQQTDSADDVATLRLRGLSSGTEYIAEASLDSTFPSGETMSVTFTTKERRDDDDTPVIVAQEARAVTAPLPGYSPQMLRFVAIEGGDSPSPQTFSVWNRAQGAMDFILSNQQEWLALEPDVGCVRRSRRQGGHNRIRGLVGTGVGSVRGHHQHRRELVGQVPDQIVVVLDVLPPDYVRQFVSRDEGGTVILPDGTVKIVVQPLSPPEGRGHRADEGEPAGARCSTGRPGACGGCDRVEHVPARRRHTRGRCILAPCRTLGDAACC